MFKNSNHPTSPTQGFTLVEVVIGLAIIGVVLVSASTLFVTGLNHFNQGSSTVQAAFLAQHLMEEVIALTPAGLETLVNYERTSPIPVEQDGRFSFTRIIREDSSSGLIRLDVTVLWPSTSGQRAYRVVTMLAKP